MPAWGVLRRRPISLAEVGSATCDVALLGAAVRVFHHRAPAIRGRAAEVGRLFGTPRKADSVLSRSSNQKRKRKARLATGVPCASGVRKYRRMVKRFLKTERLDGEAYLYVLDTGRLPDRLEVH